jgi:hypothetical protein
MASTFVSKSRRVRFELTLRILDLNNVPLVTGTSFVKWDLPASTAAEHRGRTSKCAIRDHRVQYNYEKQTAIRLTLAKDGMLQECIINLEVLQEYSSGGRGERIKLGHIHLNLAEYVDAAGSDVPSSPTYEAEEGIVRRYLMQESKINSTLKIGIYMRHIEGTRDYTAPPLRAAPVFGGIAGIISSSEPVGAQGNPDALESGPDTAPPQGFNANNKETGEMQDMYRRTLAAFWASQPGELKADECIEDIFSGGDGWGKQGKPEQSQPGSGASTPNPHHLHDGLSRDSSSASKAGGGPTGRGMPAHKHNFSGAVHRNKGLRKQLGEVDETEVRDDLVMWQIGSKAYS